MEIWKDIPKYKWRYQASNYGRVKSLPRYIKNRLGGKRWFNGCLLKLCKHQCSELEGDYYLGVMLSKNGKKHPTRVHRIVAQLFVPNPLNLREVNHKDNDRFNNYATNLEWLNARENSSHHCLSKPKTSKYIGVHWDKGAGKWRAAIKIKRRTFFLGHYLSQESAASAYQGALTKNRFMNRYTKKLPKFGLNSH